MSYFLVTHREFYKLKEQVFYLKVACSILASAVIGLSIALHSIKNDFIVPLESGNIAKSLK